MSKLAAPKTSPELLLSVKSLRVTVQSRLDAIIDNFDLDVARGEAVAIVGESGAGKSLTVKSLVGILPDVIKSDFTLCYEGEEIKSSDINGLRGLRGKKISLLMQDPFTILNPVMRVREHLAEMLKRHHLRKWSKQELREEIFTRLREVGIEKQEIASMYPFQLSGGLRQRVALATALCADPALLLADEPTTALDPSTQKEILDLLRRLRESRGMGLVLITHDLRVAFSSCDRIVVMYKGRVVEQGSSKEIEKNPAHPYTTELLLSEPPLNRALSQLPARDFQQGLEPTKRDACVYSNICKWADNTCREAMPPKKQLTASHVCYCIKADELRARLTAAMRFEMPVKKSADRRSAGELVAEAANLSRTFRQSGNEIKALDNVSLTIHRGESVGLIGESGSGKSTLGRCLVGLEVADSGRTTIMGLDISKHKSLKRVEKRRLRDSIQMVFQDPYCTLNPVLSIGKTLGEALSIRNPGTTPKERLKGVEILLGEVGLPASYASKMPHELSGGERQRIAIARVLAVKPNIIVLDEPVSALDVLVQAQIINLLNKLLVDNGTSYLFISHDLAVVRQMVSYLYVILKGKVVEEGLVDEIIDNPKHWYTRQLVEASSYGGSENNN